MSRIGRGDIIETLRLKGFVVSANITKHTSKTGPLPVPNSTMMLQGDEGASADNAAIAYVDESVRPAANPPAYLLAATILTDKNQLAPFEALLPKGARKLHWTDMTNDLRGQSVHLLSELSHVTTVVVAAPLNPKKQRRARTKCIERLLPELEGLGVSVAVFESLNNKVEDVRDVEAAERMRATGTISSVRVEHACIEEHSLCLPDQMLGAYWHALCVTRGSSAWANEWETVLVSVDVIEINL